VDEDAQPVAYTGVPIGVPLLSSSGQQFGTLVKVLEIPSEDLFDGVIVATATGQRFVDRDQIAQITTAYIRCDLDDEAVAALPEPSGSATFQADMKYASGGRFRNWMRRTFGRGGWKADQ
jgi:hypothetical protein